jgi:parallel beta-helix repeat protein
VNSAQFGIVTVSDPNYGTGDGTDVSTNSVTGTQIFDAIDLCSNNNSAKSNTVYGNAESGIHLDDTCGSTGNSNTVSANVVNEACAGILLGYGTDNTYSPNSYYNVVNTTFAGGYVHLAHIWASGRRKGIEGAAVAVHCEAKTITFEKEY